MRMRHSALCKKDHVASMTSCHKQGLARPGTIASAMIEDCFVEVPEAKRRHRRRGPVVAEALASKSSLDVLTHVDELIKALTVPMSQCQIPTPRSFQIEVQPI
jgi:hypothetical protein